MQNMKIDGSVNKQMVALAQEKAPIEACAILGGADDVVSAFISMTNADNAAEHFSFLPQEQFAAVKQLRAEGKAMLAIWHSHPATPARMSDEDLRLAYATDVAYVILSLADEAGPVLKAFNVVEGQPQEMQLEIGEDNDE